MAGFPRQQRRYQHDVREHNDAHRQEPDPDRPSLLSIQLVQFQCKQAFLTASVKSTVDPVPVKFLLHISAGTIPGGAERHPVQGHKGDIIVCCGSGTGVQQSDAMQKRVPRKRAFGASKEW